MMTQGARRGGTAVLVSKELFVLMSVIDIPGQYLSEPIRSTPTILHPSLKDSYTLNSDDNW